MKPVFAIRGIMLDLARVTERKSYYRSLVPWLSKWGYNLIHLHLTDDQGCALRFPSHPELAGDGAFSAAEMKDFIELARKHNLSVLPELECLGHARFIAGNPKHRHLADQGLEKGAFNALCPSHPGTKTLLADLLRDTAHIFDYPVLHAGLDEVKFGQCPRCTGHFGKDATDGDRFIAHARWVHDEIRRLGRRPAMWVDHQQAKSTPGMVESFQRDVLMFHWHYRAEYGPATADTFLEAGYEVIACPSSVCWYTRLAPNSDNLANLRTASARSIHPRRRKLLGAVNTVWCPWRYLPGSIDYALALAGHLFSVPHEDLRFAERFARQFYAVGAPHEVGRALRQLARCTPKDALHDRIISDLKAKEPWNREDRRVCRELAAEVEEIVAVLQAHRSSVKKNLDRYDDVLITAEIVLALAIYGASGRKRTRNGSAGLLLKRSLESWNQSRYADDTHRFGDPDHHGNDALLKVAHKLAG